MSRAYCLTCNEQVMVTASGTCPAGHAVTSGNTGPEPWVGRTREPEARTTESATSAHPTTTSIADVDVAELEELQLASLGAQAGNGHAPSARNGHAAPSGDRPVDTPTPPTGDTPVEAGTAVPDEPGDAPTAPHVGRQRANSQASDDLAAMLAEALQSGEATAPDEEAADDAATPPTPAEPAPVVTTEDDWDDLATLAAELQLDTSLPADAEVEPAPESDTQSPPSSGPAPRTADEPTDATPPPPPAPGTDIWSAGDGQETGVPDVADAPVEDLPSPAPVPEPDEVPAPATEAEEATTSSVDLTNFTARGNRVGAAGRTSPRRLFGRKR